MEADDSASDGPHSHHSYRRSRRESPLPPPKNPNKSPISERRVSEKKRTRRSSSKKSRERSSEERGTHLPGSESKARADEQELQPNQVSSTSGRVQHNRHSKRKSKSRNEKKDVFVETPVTRVLREVPDDILDTSVSNLTQDGHYTYYGNVDFDLCKAQQKRRDCVFVEHYDGFSSVPRHNALSDSPGTHDNSSWFDLKSSSALDVAINIQKTWIPHANFCHGLLAGISLMQAIVVDRLFGSSPEELSHFISFYSNFSLIFTSTFLLLASVCLVSVFDRLDLARGEWPYLLDLLSIRPKIPWLLIPIYVMGLILSLAAAKGDDLIHVSQYNNSNFTLQKDDRDLLTSWHVLNSLRCACVVIGWLFLSASQPPDLLLNLLTELLPHQNAEVKQSAEVDQTTSH